MGLRRVVAAAPWVCARHRSRRRAHGRAARRRRAPSHRARAHPRELEVARLVAEGLTNPEIAERLQIGRRTVATHLEHIYGRLEIGSRAELARRLAEVGLA